jgi:hypothetical protein
MSDAPPADLVAATRADLARYADVLPPLDARYFARPPLKFLSLVVAGISARTGFAAGVFTAAELAGELAGRREKHAFFVRLRRYVECVTGERADVSARAIITGREVAKTLLFLRRIVRAAEQPARAFEAARARLEAAEAAQPAGERADAAALRAEVERLRAVVRAQRAESARGGGGAGMDNRFAFAATVPRPAPLRAPRRVVRFVPTPAGEEGERGQG